jgi:hypothetical protein
MNTLEVDMKYRNEIILAACFLMGNIVASWPGDVADYAERTESTARTASVPAVSPVTEGLLASAISSTALTSR